MAGQKRTYKAPVLRVLGTVQDLTQGNLATGTPDLEFLNIVTTP